MIIVSGALICPSLSKKFSKRDLCLAGCVIAVAALFINNTSFSWMLSVTIIRAIGQAPITADALLKSIVSVANGQVIKVEEVPDDVFTSKALGDGATVIVEDGRVYAPADGEVTMVAETLHAYGITTADGLELLEANNGYCPELK
ncbi:MAG: PTS glucose transporter subunit IIA [Butyricicoccaceae bacterium]